MKRYFEQMKLRITVILFYFIGINANAQLVVNNTTYTTNQLVQNVLLGGGITVSNITFNGIPKAIGFFNGTNSNIGLDSGIVMTTGDIFTATGPNNGQGATCPDDIIGVGRPGDTDLDIISPDTTYDAAILEFDFISLSESVKFRYVFGSEEYMEYVNSGFNDVFGFFISGPGITGPYSNNSQNIALIPGTATPVTIDSLNLNVHGAYYFDNGDGITSGTVVGTAPDGATVQYDGFTIPMVATAKIQCGKTYHIKLAIADAGDPVLDSGVFLEAGSFVFIDPISLSTSINVADTVCPNDLVPINAIVSGTITGTPLVVWDFDGGEVASGSGLGPYQIKWPTPGTKKIELTVQPSATDTCGMRTSDIYIVITDCEVKAPNVFTPNNDGKNDFLKFRNLDKYPESKLLVYDRWGSLIYENSDYRNNWTAHEIADGTYYYILSVSNANKDTMTGFVTVIR